MEFTDTAELWSESLQNDHAVAVTLMQKDNEAVKIK